MVFGWGKSAAQKQKEEEQASQIIQLRHQLEQTSDLYARLLFQCYKKCENSENDKCAENCAYKYKEVQFIVDDRAERIMVESKKIQEEQLKQLPQGIQNLIK